MGKHWLRVELWGRISSMCSDKQQRKHQKSSLLGNFEGNHRSLVDSPQDGPIIRKEFSYCEINMVINGHFIMKLAVIGIWRLWPPFRRQCFPLSLQECTKADWFFTGVKLTHNHALMCGHKNYRLGIINFRFVLMQKRSNCNDRHLVNVPSNIYL